MRRLDRYVVVEFSKFLLMAIGFFVALFIIVDLFEKLDKFVDFSAKLTDIALYYLYGTPYTIVLTTPIAMLLASLLLVGQLGRAGELVAMFSAGISFFRILRPILIFSILMSVASYALAEWVMPRSLLERDVILNERIRKGSAPSQFRKRDVAYMGRGDRLYYIRTVDSGHEVLRDVVLQEFDHSGRLHSRIDAREAVFQNGAWLFRTGYFRSGLPDSERVAAFRNLWRTDLGEEPDDLFRLDPDPLNMGRADLGRYIERLRESRVRTRKFEVDYHIKLSYPLINWIIVLLGASLSVRIRRTGWALGLGLSLFIGFAYYGFIRVGQALGYSGAVSPLFAAWVGNLAFLAVAVGFQVRANR
jgi:lipopolysaccharide export system permease protein